VVGYVIAWLLFPVDDEQGTIGSRAVSDRKGLLVVVALLPVLVAVLVVGSALDAGYLSSVAWAVYLSAGGLILVYRNADDAERVWLHRVCRAGHAPRIRVGPVAPGTHRTRGGRISPTFRRVGASWCSATPAVSPWICSAGLS